MRIKLEPHEYQLQAMQFMVEHPASGLLLQPGLGKTVITLSAIKALKLRKIVKRVLVIAPRRVCHEVWPNEVKKWDVAQGLSVAVAHGPKKAAALVSDADIVCINPEGLPWLVDMFKKAPVLRGHFDMLVVDECFPGETLVRTTNGPQQISTLKVGDMVQTDIGPRRVVRTQVRPASAIVKLRLSNGDTIRSTHDHPFFTDLGWLPAKYCTGRRVFSSTDMQDLHRGVYDKSIAGTREAYDRHRACLLEILLAARDVEVQTIYARAASSTNGQSANRAAIVEQRSSVVGHAPTEYVEQCQTPGADVHETRGQWGRDVSLRNAAAISATYRIYLELRDRVGGQAAWLSHLLQSRFWRSNAQARRRSGWGQPPADGAQSAGSEEGDTTSGTRVDSVTSEQLDGSVDVWNLEVEGVERFYAGGVLVHNSTKFKNSTTQRFKILKTLLAGFKRRHILTGTPAPRGLEDLFSQIFILDGGERLGRFVTHFRRMYFTEHRNAWQQFSEWTPAIDAEERIHAKISDICLSMKTVDHLSMPELIFNDILAEVDRTASNMYQMMEKHFVAELKSGAVTAMNAAVMSGKLRQIAAGFAYTTPNGMYDVVHEAKLDALEDLIEECAGQPLLVGVAFTSEADEIKMRLRSDFGAVPYLGAGISDTKVAHIIAAWNTGKLPVLLAHPASVAHGLNLQAGGNQLCWFSLTWSLEDYQQFINRVYRQGQTRGVVVHRLLASFGGVPLSIESAILDRLELRSKTQMSIMDSLKRNFT